MTTELTQEQRDRTEDDDPFTFENLEKIAVMAGARIERGHLPELNLYYFGNEYSCGRDDWEPESPTARAWQIQCVLDGMRGEIYINRKIGVYEVGVYNGGDGFQVLKTGKHLNPTICLAALELMEGEE